MHVYKGFLQFRQTKNRPTPLTSAVVEQTMARFRNFYSLQKNSRFSLKRHGAFRTGANIYLSENNILGLGAPKKLERENF